MDSVWVVDLDGVMWRGSEAISGSAEAVERLVESGRRVVFCTNHALGPEIKAAQLAAMSVDDAEVVTSAQAVAASCSPDQRVLVMGEDSLVGVLRSSGLDVTDVFDLGEDGPATGFDVVVVGAIADWDRSRCGLIADAIRGGARYLATNEDPTYPITGRLGPRLLPGAGALVAAVSTAAGATPEVAGKPNRAMADLITRRFGTVDFVVGDQPSTDGALAAALGAHFALVLSGVTSPEEIPEVPSPAVVGKDFADVVRTVLGSPK